MSGGLDLHHLGMQIKLIIKIAGQNQKCVLRKYDIGNNSDAGSGVP
jgi:hypothetical protein